MAESIPLCKCPIVVLSTCLLMDTWAVAQSSLTWPGHTVHMLTQPCLLPPLTGTVMSSLFTHAPSSPLSLAARLHWCCTNHSCYINDGWTFSGQTLYLSLIQLPDLSKFTNPSATEGGIGSPWRRTYNAMTRNGVNTSPVFLQSGLLPFAGGKVCGSTPCLFLRSPIITLARTHTWDEYP